MVGHCAPLCHCPSPAASFAPPIAVHHSRSSNISRSASKARLIADLHDDRSYKKFQYFGVAGFMFVSSVIVASTFGPDWQESLMVATIMFSYWTATILLLLKRWDDIDAQRVLELTPLPCEKSGAVQLWLVVTGIMVSSMVLVISIFPSKSDDADTIVFFSLLAAFVLSLSLLIHWEYNHKKERERKAALQDLKKHPPI